MTWALCLVPSTQDDCWFGWVMGLVFDLAVGENGILWPRGGIQSKIWCPPMMGRKGAAAGEKIRQWCDLYDSRPDENESFSTSLTNKWMSPMIQDPRTNAQMSEVQIVVLVARRSTCTWISSTEINHYYNGWYKFCHSLWSPSPLFQRYKFILLLEDTTKKNVGICGCGARSTGRSDPRREVPPWTPRSYWTTHSRSYECVW